MIYNRLSGDELQQDMRIDMERNLILFKSGKAFY